MTIWIIVRKGMYRHEILGAWFEEKDATEAARKLASSEGAGYHEIAVREIDVEDARRIAGFTNPTAGRKKI